MNMAENYRSVSFYHYSITKAWGERILWLVSYKSWVYVLTVSSQGNKILQQKVVGGVTLNHLAWAAQVGGKLFEVVSTVIWNYAVV